MRATAFLSVVVSGEYEMVESDSNLIGFFLECDPFELHTLVRAMKSRLSPFSRKLAEQYPNMNDIPEAYTPERTELSIKMLKVLRWYGSNAIAYGRRKIVIKEGGCHYHRILRDTARILNLSQKRKNRKKLPKVASVAEWEELICSFLLASTLKGKNPEEVATMFEEAGLDVEAAKSAAKQFVPSTAVGMSLPIIAKFLGKKTITRLIEQVLIQLTYRRIGKEAAKQMAKRLLVKVPQKTFVKLVSGVGLLLIAVDAILFFSSPARRITVPTVSMISALRSLNRLKSMD